MVRITGIRPTASMREQRLRLQTGMASRGVNPSIAAGMKP